MNFKFKVKGFEVKMKGEGNIKVDEIEVAYEDVKLTEIPAIIKEARKAIVDLKDAFQEPRVEQHDLFMHATVPPMFEDGFPFFGGFPQAPMDFNQQNGQDTDGDSIVDGSSVDEQTADKKAKTK